MNTRLLRLILVVFLTTTALAACSFSGEVDVTVPPSNLVVETNWWLQHADGRVEYVLCDNRLANVYSSFRVSGSSQVESVSVRQVGVNQETSSTVTFNSAQLTREGNKVSLPTMVFAPGTTPFGLAADDDSLEAQAIVIVPSDPGQRQGFLRLHYTVRLTTGASYAFNPLTIDVWGGCTDS